MASGEASEGILPADLETCVRVLITLEANPALLVDQEHE
jgi:hypothetical protein